MAASIRGTRGKALHVTLDTRLETLRPRDVDHDTTILELRPLSHKQFSLTTETQRGFAARYAPAALLDIENGGVAREGV